MQPRRVFLVLLAAVAISGCFTLWFARHLARTRVRIAGGLHYVAPVKALDAGDVLTAQSVQMMEWPGNAPLQGAFVRADEVVGKTVMYPLAAGEPILSRHLAAAGTGLAGRIPQGMRAISLKSNEVVGVAGYLLPGTHVDVLVTARPAMSQEPVTSTVLQDTQVLTAGQKMEPDPDGRASHVDVVTLLVSPQDAEKVVLASTQGTLHFVLRNGVDHGRLAQAPASMASLDEGVSKRPAVVQAKDSPRLEQKVIPKQVSHYTIQVRRGDKDSVETFQ